jgi:hypothetical protein
LQNYAAIAFRANDSLVGDSVNGQRGIADIVGVDRPVGVEDIGQQLLGGLHRRVADIRPDRSSLLAYAMARRTRRGEHLPAAGDVATQLKCGLVRGDDRVAVGIVGVEHLLCEISKGRFRMLPQQLSPRGADVAGGQAAVSNGVQQQAHACGRGHEQVEYCLPYRGELRLKRLQERLRAWRIATFANRSDGGNLFFRRRAVAGNLEERFQGGEIIVQRQQPDGGDSLRHVELRVCSSLPRVGK